METAALCETARKKRKLVERDVRDQADAVVPAHDELCRCAASGRVLHNDDTVRILELMGKRRAELVVHGEVPNPDRTGLFTTGVVSITAAGPVALFFSGGKHGGENFTSLFDAREPGLPPPVHVCNGLDRNRPRGDVVIENNCLAQGRLSETTLAETRIPQSV